MSHKFTLITGASSDIGLETVKLLLGRNEFVWGVYNNNRTLISLDLGISNTDLNLFSNIDDQNNIGVGAKFSIEKIFSQKGL